MRRIGSGEQSTPLDDEQIRAAYEFPDARPWVRASMVATLDGVVRGRDGDSRSIASAADRRVFSMLRLRADVVLVGAGTLRSVDYPPSRLPIAVVSNSLDLPPSLRLFADAGPDSPRTIVYTTAKAADRSDRSLAERVDVVATGEADVDLHGVVHDLAARGLGRVHCEGGPRLLSALADAQLIDEILLTVTPRLHGGEDHVLSVAGGLDQRYRIASLIEEDGSVFIRAIRTPT